MSPRTIHRAAFSAVLLLLVTSSCGGRFNPAITGGAASQVGAAQGGGRHVVTSPSLVGRSVDGAYQIRTLHAPGLTVHQSIATTTAAGTFTQVDYMTPLGVLTLVQKPKRVAPPARASATSIALRGASSAADQADATEVVAVAAGTTSHGAQWFAYLDPSGNAYDIHVDFGDSTIDTNVPKSVAISTITSTVGELY